MGRVSTCQKNCNTIDLSRAQVNNDYNHNNDTNIDNNENDNDKNSSDSMPVTV